MKTEIIDDFTKNKTLEEISEKILILRKLQ